MTKKEFKQMFGEDPEDILGGDWKNLVDDYAQKLEKEYLDEYKELKELYE